MPLTTDQIALLDQILDKGYATKTIKMLGGKVEATFNSLLGAEQMKVEALMKDMQSMSQAEAVHKISTKLLSQALRHYHETGKDIRSFATPDEAEKFLVNLPVVVIDTMIAAQGNFERELSALARAENLEANFSLTPSEGPKPS